MISIRVLTGARIKKIMQADEDIGKIALPVPLLVSKALEQFLQNLCKRTCEITLQRGAKTISAYHLKHCIQRFTTYDFLQEIVSKVPDMGTSEGRHIARRRRAHEDDDTETDDELKRARVSKTRGCGRGRGRVRGRRLRGFKSSARKVIAADKYEEDLDVSSEHSDMQVRNPEGLIEVNKDEQHHSKDTPPFDNAPPGRGFDLNLELDENGDVAMPQANVQQQKEYLCGNLSNGDDVTVYPSRLQINFHRTIDQDEDDYDNEDG